VDRRICHTRTRSGPTKGTALNFEFKHDINAYLAKTGGKHPKDLAGLIASKQGTCEAGDADFGQETFEQAQGEPAVISPTRRT